MPRRSVLVAALSLLLAALRVAPAAVTDPWRQLDPPILLIVLARGGSGTAARPPE